MLDETRRFARAAACRCSPPVYVKTTRTHGRITRYPRKTAVKQPNSSFSSALTYNHDLELITFEARYLLLL